jgi:hypothetical protein
MRDPLCSMGRKGRSKKYRKERVRRAPDEVFAQGPLRIERYGRYVRLSNTSTLEEHAAFLERTKEVHKEVLIELEHELATLQDFVGRYEPVELMHRAAYELLPLLLKYRSENEFKADESLFLPAIEYLQYLIARTEPNTNGKTPSEAEWKETWDQTLKVMNLTLSYLVTRGTSASPPTPVDELRFMFDARRLGVRVQRYPFFLADHLRASLSPYEQQVKEVYGMGAEEIVEGLLKIDEYLRSGVIGRYLKVHDLTNALMERLRAKGYAVDPGASEEEVERTREALETPEFRTMHQEMQEKIRLTFTSALFEITNVTSLPREFLSLLSVKPGESPLKSLTGPGHDDLSPLSPSFLHYKPFLEVDDRFYAFYHSGLDDHIQDIIEADLLQKLAGHASAMLKRRSDRLEADSRDLLISIIKPDFAYQNVYYPNPAAAGNLTELDLLFGVDDLLFLVEAKAGSLSPSARRGAPRALEQDFSDLIIEGQRQSERAEKYIRSAEEVAFFDETGRREVNRIRHTQLRRIFRIVTTREDLGWVGARIAILSVFDPGLSRSYPWHVSLDDLRVIAELFRNDEIRFVHYLEVRLAASAETSLSQDDELEHIGLYNERNYYHISPVLEMDQLTYDTSYMHDIDQYFMDRVTGESPPIPTQEMPPKMRQFISALRASRLPHRFEVGSIVLSMDMAGRKEFQAGLDALDEGRAEGRQRTFRMPFTDLKFGISISYAGGPNWPEELRRSAVQMERGNCERWLVVQLANESSYEVSEIEVITPTRFTDAELAAERSRHETRTREKIAAQRPGRNDQCPCGSGRKYKRCHGFRA